MTDETKITSREWAAPRPPSRTRPPSGTRSRAGPRAERSGAAPADRPEVRVGMSAGNRFSFFLGSKLPWLSHLQFSLMARVMRGNPAGAMRQMQRLARGADKTFLQNHPEFIADVAASSRESFRQGAAGVEWQFG